MDNWIINYIDKANRYQSFECFANDFVDVLNQLVEKKEFAKISLVTEAFICDED